MVAINNALTVFLKKKSACDPKKHEKLPRRQRVKGGRRLFELRFFLEQVKRIWLTVGE